MKVNLNKGDVIEVTDSEANFYLVSGFHRVGEAPEVSRVVKTSNKETQAMLDQTKQEAKDNQTPDEVIAPVIDDPLLLKRQEMLDNQQSPFEK